MSLNISLTLLLFPLPWSRLSSGFEKMTSVVECDRVPSGPSVEARISQTTGDSGDGVVVYESRIWSGVL
jgi:hypothetical protein